MHIVGDYFFRTRPKKTVSVESIVTVGPVPLIGFVRIKKLQHSQQNNQLFYPQNANDSSIKGIYSRFFLIFIFIFSMRSQFIFSWVCSHQVMPMSTVMVWLKGTSVNKFEELCLKD